MLEHSDLIIAQEFMPTDFDWRIGVLDNKLLYACKYYMARNHWQIYNRENNSVDYGISETLAIEQLPAKLKNISLKSAALIGSGLYGIDIKEKDGKYFVIEINDNPSIDYGIEDGILKDHLYSTIMHVFLQRLEIKTKGNSNVS